MIYQFIPVAPVPVMERLIRAMAPGTMAVLDLEDGYLDVRDPGKTNNRRARGREQLLELCASAKGRTNGRAVAMRVNVAFSHSRAERDSVRRSRRQINTEPLKDFSHGLTRMGPIGLRPLGLETMPRAG